MILLKLCCCNKNVFWHCERGAVDSSAIAKAVNIKHAGHVGQDFLNIWQKMSAREHEMS